MSKVENKILEASGLMTTAVLDTKIGEVENKIRDVKTDCNSKISDIEKQYFTVSDYNKFTKNAWCKNKRKGGVKNSDLNTKLATRATKAELKAEQEKIMTLQVFNSNYFCGKSHFKNNGTQNYLVFQPVLRNFNKVANSNNISRWKSKRLSD